MVAALLQFSSWTVAATVFRYCRCLVRPTLSLWLPQQQHQCQSTFGQQQCLLCAGVQSQQQPPPAISSQQNRQRRRQPLQQQQQFLPRLLQQKKKQQQQSLQRLSQQQQKRPIGSFLQQQQQKRQSVSQQQACKGRSTYMDGGTPSARAWGSLLLLLLLPSLTPPFASPILSLRSCNLASLCLYQKTHCAAVSVLVLHAAAYSVAAAGSGTALAVHAAGPDACRVDRSLIPTAAAAAGNALLTAQRRLTLPSAVVAAAAVPVPPQLSTAALTSPQGMPPQQQPESAAVLRDATATSRNTTADSRGSSHHSRSSNHSSRSSSHGDTTRRCRNPYNGRSSDSGTPEEMATEGGAGAAAATQAAAQGVGGYTATDNVVVGLVTCKDQAEAEKVAETLVTQQLAACVNIIPAIRSIYMWKGELQKDEETLLVMKTRKQLQPRVAAAVVQAHSYDVPEVIFTPIVGGYAPYLHFVKENTTA